MLHSRLFSFRELLILGRGFQLNLASGAGQEPGCSVPVAGWDSGGTGATCEARRARTLASSMNSLPVPPGVSETHQRIACGEVAAEHSSSKL